MIMKKINTLILVISFSIQVFGQNPGELDESFGYLGTRFISYGDTNIFAQKLALQSDGSIILAGGSFTQAGSDRLYDIAIVKLDSEGYVDYDFGNDGFVSFDFGEFEYATGLTVLDNDNILLSALGGTDPDYLVYLIKLEPDGQPDNTFGNNGVVSLQLPSDRATYFSGLVYKMMVKYWYVAVQDQG